MGSVGDIGITLVALRKERGIPQRELGETLGVRQQQIARWEASTYRSASLERVDAVADALGLATGGGGGQAPTAAEGGAVYRAASSSTVPDPSSPAPAQDLAGVIGRLRAHRVELAGRYGIASLAVFGSFATGGQTGESDVDLLAEMPEPGGFRFIEAAGRVEELLGRHVDLVRPELLHARLKDRVTREAIEVWGA
jgi:predicted nucleotidyltransferase/DNA-binding XRE family transcriptional regulator